MQKLLSQHFNCANAEYNSSKSGFLKRQARQTYIPFGIFACLLVGLAAQTRSCRRVAAGTLSRPLAGYWRRCRYVNFHALPLAVA